MDGSPFLYRFETTLRYYVEHSYHKRVVFSSFEDHRLYNGPNPLVGLNDLLDGAVIVVVKIVDARVSPKQVATVVVAPVVEIVPLNVILDH